MLLHYVLYKRLLLWRFLIYFFTLPPKEIILKTYILTYQSSTNRVLSISFIYACLVDPGMYLEVILTFLTHSANVYISHIKWNAFQQFICFHLCRLLMISFDYLYSLYKFKSVPYIIQLRSISLHIWKQILSNSKCQVILIDRSLFRFSFNN